ncbi:MAG: TIGR04283 family arsenosugar biosynthesis glycosyltransferase [Deltaproteobacteria bacterium]|nr:TIGR04283 family arsenosugar biosynthesis glycosyltransferase [Deltaproteobacteria bacterium]
MDAQTALTRTPVRPGANIFPSGGGGLDVHSAAVKARISVIVPVLDEVRRIDALLGALVPPGAPDPCLEVIVVDGGSRDGTQARVRAFPSVRLVEAPRGRARQMNAGAREASGEALLFLHADTTLPPGALDRLRETLDAGADFGCFELSIESQDPRLRVASTMISLRSRLIPSATGDQAQWFRRAFFWRLGGFPDLPLFEDLRIVGTAAGRGRYACVPLRVGTSARRWQAHGVSRTMARMLLLRGLYHLGVDPRVLARFYATNPRGESHPTPHDA